MLNLIKGRFDRLAEVRNPILASSTDIQQDLDFMLRTIDVAAFVDWQSQIANAGQLVETRPDRRAQRTIEFVTSSIAEALAKTREADRFRVEIRLYHGWHKSLTRTDNRVALDSILTENLVVTAIRNVSFDWSKLFGDTLLDASDHRLHGRLRIHLPDTLRDELDSKSGFREKMVDTAMVCDILFSARSAPHEWRVVLAEDDDMVPAIFVAERWGKERGGRTMLLRTRAGHGHLALDGLLWKLERVHR